MPQPKLPVPKTFGKLTTKQQNFFIAWQEYGFAPEKRAQAAMDAGYALSNLSGGAKAAIESVSGNEKMQSALKRKGITYDFIASNIKDKFDCTRPVVVDKKVEYVPDNSNQLRAIEIASKMKDAMPANKLDINERRQVEIFISHETIQRGNNALEEGVIDIDAIDCEFVE